MKRILLLLYLAAAVRAADDVPQWLRAAASEKLGAVDAKAPAIYLLRDTGVAVEESGRVVTTDRVAIRVLSRTGSTFARAAKVYLRDTGKVRDIKAWVIAPSGDVIGIVEVVLWRYRCTGCGRYFEDPTKECPVCGSRVKTTRARPRG